MNPIIFNEMGESDAGWKTVYNQDSAEGIQRNDVLPDSEHKGIKLKPRPVTKPTKKPVLENQMPGNIGRPSTQMTEYTVRNRPERVPVLFQPSSPSTKEFYYAPNDLSVGAKRVRAEALNLPHDWPEESQTNYGDSDSNLTVGEDGYSKVEEDSNFSRNPRTWRFLTKDRDKNLETRDEALPDLTDVSIGNMVYPLQSGLRPIVFDAKPSREKRKKEKAKAKPKTEDAVVTELAKKAEAKPPVKPEKVDPFLEPPEGFVQQKTTEAERNQGLKELEEYHEAEQAFYTGDQQTNAKEVAELEKNLPPEKKTELEALSPEDKKTWLRVLWNRNKNPRSKNSGYRGNILEDPALLSLKPEMTDQEKVFTTIRKWEGDSYVNSAENLDAGTKDILKKVPIGEEHYFSWRYISPEESEKNADKDIKKEGYTISPGQGALSVTRKPGWAAIEVEVQNKRRQRPA